MSSPATAPATVEDVAWLSLDEVSDTRAARRAAEQLAQRIGLPVARVAEVGLAVTELATNVQIHGGGGAILLRSIRAGASAAVEVVTVDSGPGIVDVGIARRDGHSTAGTLGVGLGMVARLADQLDIASRPGRGTVLAARFEADRQARPTLAADATGPLAAGISRAASGKDVCGDAYAVRREGTRISLMVCDGSGQGMLAAAAAREAVRAFTDCTQPASPPEVALLRIHQALAGSCGGAVAIAELDPDIRRLRFVGIGNVAGAVVSAREKRNLVSQDGHIGYHKPALRSIEHVLPADSVVVLHSDGVRECWSCDEFDQSVVSTPLLIAATLLRDAGIRTDDACVLVGRVNR
ncbi:MAG: ATP-binding protein/SpoIIE family protein phosphatase [Actinomycetota bacterium]|nr:ATP-binding protein/SpoIIE family protein phosphatase [Actinomycetota bacterium]